MLRKFTDEELNNIINDYKNGMCPKDLSIKYNRNSGTIIGKLQRLGIYVNSTYHYSKDDIEFLRKYYSIGDFDSIFERLPNVTIQTIRTVCSKHNVKAEYVSKWTEEDLDILKENYFIMSEKEISKLMNYRHSAYAINTKARRHFGFSKDKKWTDEEIDILKKYYSTESIEYVMDKLPNRTYQAIGKKANLLGMYSYFTLNNYWNDEETQILLDNWETKSDEEIAKILNKNKRSISEKRWNLGLLRFNHYNNATYNNLQKYIRGNIGEWKSQSMKNCNYKCVLTGSKNFEIHHIYSFSLILNEVIEENNFNIKDNFCDYTPQELSFILEKFIEKQNQYPLGVCLDKELHKLLHKEYGKYVGVEQWEKFKENYERENITQ